MQKQLKKVILAVTNDICTDQRVLKTCQTLVKNGYLPLVVGRMLPNSLAVKNVQHRRFKMLFNKGFLFYAEYNIRLFFFLLFSTADIITANDLDSLPACFVASRLKRCKLIYDSHELFTELPELQNRKSVKKTWETIEALLLPHCRHNSTVCQSIADFYTQKYNRNFIAIRNLPPYTKTQAQKHGKTKTLLYQGVLNIGRGIELMIETMHLLPEYRLLIAGSGDIEKELKAKVDTEGLNERVIFLGRLERDELMQHTASALIGFSLEENRGLNYYYALPNKLFDYIQAEIPVIVSDFPEMSRIVNQYKTGLTLSKACPHILAETVKKLEENLQSYKTACHKAKNELCWEQNENALINLYNK